MLKLFLCEQNGCQNFVVPAFKLLHHFVIIIPLRTNWVSEIRSPFLCSFRHFAIITPLRTNWVSEIRSPFLYSFRHFVIIIPLGTKWVSEIRSPFLCSYCHFAIFHCEQNGCLKFVCYLLAVTFTIYSLYSIFLKTCSKNIFYK